MKTDHTLEKHINQNSDLIEQLIQGIVAFTQPTCIYLFGSVVNESNTEPGDIDILVVMPDGTHCSQTTRLLYKKLNAFPYPVDIIVVTAAILEQHKDNIGLIYHTILKEGKQIYAA